MTANQIELPNGLGTLKPTLGAAKNINAAFGSFMEALRRVSALDLGAMITIVAFGLDEKQRDVEDDVWAAGTDLVQPLSDYLTLLANGGRPIKSEKEPKSGEA